MADLTAAMVREIAEAARKAPQRPTFKDEDGQDCYQFLVPKQQARGWYGMIAMMKQKSADRG